MKYLIVIDMQKDFVTGALGTKEAQAILPNVIARIEAAKAAGETVLYTLDTHETNYMDTAEGRKLPVPHCIRGSQGWEIIDQLAEYTQDRTIVDKPTFGSAELGQVLTKLDGEETIEKITLIGLCTDICVISNALLAKAFLTEAEVAVDAACCAGVTPESHNNALAAMKVCQITVENA